jgi:peptidoglycan/xylan/chitin deacetylase (PgdA/CDA1 family)
MDWSAAQALLASGHGVGSHTCTHAVLSRETVELQEHEVKESRRILEEQLRSGIEVLALPNGRQQDYDGDTLRLMAQAGYHYGLTTRAGFAMPEHPALEVRRVLLEPETSLTDVLKEAARDMRRRASATRRH